MTNITNGQQINDPNIEAIAMGGSAAEQILKSNADALAKKGKEAERFIAANSHVLGESGNIALTGFQELARAYQALATKNAARLTASIQALAAAKTPTEFVELQQKLMAEGVEAAVGDFRNIAKLTTAAFTASFEPLRKQMEVVPLK